MENNTLISKKLTKYNEKNLIDNKINLFYQFFINNNLDRQKEIEYVLNKNVNNPYINNIYLLNEKIYTNQELGISSNKIIQINIGTRLKFSDVFIFINNNNIKGYNILLNSDIFFDDSINNLLYSDLHNTRKMCSLLRYEFNIQDINKSKLFTGCLSCSQDTWIIHSNNKLTEIEIANLDFEFGKPGCDNALIYLFNKFNFEIINDPLSIKTYHYHSTNYRTYTTKDTVQKKFMNILPYYNESFNNTTNIVKNDNNFSFNIILLLLLFLMVIFIKIN
jgi:hypothetical protein